MSLSAGDRIGPYSITGKLGEGGMGEVYRGHDAKLGRDAAIKILPEQFVTDPERVARFEREARTLASLNHSHIAQIYGFEHESGTLALAMEFVDGEDLAQRLTRGPLPLDDALPIAKQIAEGLAYAHERGVVHRDLKPANIKVTPDGVVKILDFGLAKAFDPATESGASDSLSLSPTITSPAMTQRGMILGTAAYMSPEQARGKTVDRRTDIWAFGCVLFELLSGTRLFKGEDVTETIVLVMSREPQWEALPASTPAPIRTLLRRCLQREKAKRLGDIHDAQLEIEDAVAGGSSVFEPGSNAVVPRPRTAGALAWAGAGLVAGAAVAFGLQSAGFTPARATPMSPLHLSILHTQGNEVGEPVISPDGARVAYRARRADGMPVLWVRDLASAESRALPGTEDAAHPFWSPDSRRVGFVAGMKLKHTPAEGGPIEILTGGISGSGGMGASWGREGTVVFAGSDVEPLKRVDVQTGQVSVALEPPGPDWMYLWPSFLPDGRRFVFTARLATESSESAAQGIYLGTLDSSQTRRLLPDLSSAVISETGHLVFGRGDQPMAVAFDAVEGLITGEPFALDGLVARDRYSNLAALSVSAAGIVASRPPPAQLVSVGSSNGRIHLLDRQAKLLGVSDPASFAHVMTLHPDGVRVAAQITDTRTATNDLYFVDVLTREVSPLTTARAYAGRPVFSPDGRRMAYTLQPPGSLDDFHIKDLRTGADALILGSKSLVEQPAAWSRDGRVLLVYRTTEPNGPFGLDTWWAESGKREKFVESTTIQAAFSPDGRFVAYGSTESGTAQVVITTFPEPKRSWPLTTDGGRPFSWSDDGKEILVASLSGHIVAYPVTVSEENVTIGKPSILIKDVGNMVAYSSANRDHSRIAIRVDADAAADRGEIQLLFGALRR